MPKQLSSLSSNVDVVSLSEARTTMAVGSHASPSALSSGTAQGEENSSSASKLDIGMSSILHRSTNQKIGHASQERQRKLKARCSDTQIGPDHLPDFIRGKTNKALAKLFPKSWAEHQTLKKKCSRASTAAKLDPSLKTFSNFLVEMGPCPEVGMSVDRIDNLNPNYAPGNIRWASPRTQARNRSTNVHVTWRGEKRTLAEWAAVTGLRYETLKKRHQRGEQADRLFRGSTVPKYRTDHQRAVPNDIDVQEPELARRLFGDDGWPLCVESREWERNFQRWLSFFNAECPAATRLVFFAWLAKPMVRSAEKAVEHSFPEWYSALIDRPDEGDPNNEPVDIPPEVSGSPLWTRWGDLQDSFSIAYWGSVRNQAERRLLHGLLKIGPAPSSPAEAVSLFARCGRVNPYGMMSIDPAQPRPRMPLPIRRKSV